MTASNEEKPAEAPEMGAAFSDAMGTPEMPEEAPAQAVTAEQAAQKIDGKVLRYETREIEADPVNWLRAIIQVAIDAATEELIEDRNSVDNKIRHHYSELVSIGKVIQDKEEAEAEVKRLREQLKEIAIAAGYNEDILLIAKTANRVILDASVAPGQPDECPTCKARSKELPFTMDETGLCTHPWHSAVQPVNPCFVCAKSFGLSSSNPLEQMMKLPYYGGNGKLRSYCSGCVLKAVHEAETGSQAAQPVTAEKAALGIFPDHLDDSPSDNIAQKKRRARAVPIIQRAIDSATTPLEAEIKRLREQLAERQAR